MRPILAILVLGILAGAGIYYYQSRSESWEEKAVTIDGHRLAVKIADTDSKRERGLQGVEKLGENEGMLFVFGDPKPVRLWNKNTFLDLDILWIKNFSVLGVDFLTKTDGSKIKVLDSPEEVDMAIEAPAGWVSRNDIHPGALVLGI